MGKLKKLIAKITVFCLMLGIVWYVQPVKAMAATSWESSYLGSPIGKVTVSNLDGDYKDGKYRFRVKVKYEKTGYYEEESNYNIKITNARLVNSSGKTVATWKDRSILQRSGEKINYFSIDFSKYTGGDYTFKYTVTAVGRDEDFSKNFKQSVSHTGGSIKYSSSKYVYDTDGNKQIQVKFKVKGLKGYAAKIQIYNANGKLIRTFPKGGKVTSNDTTYTCTWGMANDDGLTVKAGTYTMKITINGKSCCKKITIDPE